MTLTTLIGLTDEEFDRAEKDFDYEKFQLEEIARHYEARMRRREAKREIMRKLAYNTDSWTEPAKYKARWAKLNEFDRHDERDRIRWHACMDRLIALGQRWNEMVDELKASKAATA